MRLRFAILLGLLSVGLTAPLLAVDDAERLAVYRQFRTAFDAQQYPQALPVAEKLVALTEQQYGAEHAALVNPLSNLGTVHYRMGNLPAAETAFQRAVRLVDARGAGADHQLIRPLQGLGETWVAAQQYETAALALKRAVDLSRNLDGLYNVDQLPILYTLIDSYVALGRTADAEKEHQYAFSTAEKNFGASDTRLLAPLDRYARWFEYNSRYASARALHGRALQLAEKSSGVGSLDAVTPLRGIARSHYYEFLYGGEQPEQPDPLDPFTAPTPGANTAPRLNPDGEKALQLAIDALTKHAPINQKLRAETLTDLGDWYVIAGNSARAQTAYRLAWSDLAASQGTQVLAKPRRLVYRPPFGSVARSKPNKPDEWEERSVEASFTVTRDGKVVDPKIVRSDAPENLGKGLLNSLRKALYAPRIEAGETEETTDVRFTERMLVRKPTAPAAKPAPAT